MHTIYKALLLLACLFVFNYSYSNVTVTLALPQTGWSCQSTKVFAIAADSLISAPPYKIYLGSQVVDSGKMVYNGKYWNQYQYSADISTITTEGVYHLVVDKYAEGSCIISNYIFKRMRNKTGYVTIPDMIHSLWSFQRCSPEKCDTIGTFTGYYKHANDSCLPLYNVLGSTKTLVTGTSKELYGGWHDAVSTDKETPNTAITIRNMCHALERISDTASRHALIDEMKWGLDYLLKVQNTDDGSFPACIWPYFNWENPSLPRHLEINKATGIVAQCAGALAEASTILKSSDSSLSAKALNAGLHAWQWIEQNPNHFEFDTLPSWRTGTSGTVLEAVVELARATGQQKFYHYADSIISLGTFYNNGFWAKDTTLPGAKTFYGQESNVWVGQMDEASYSQTPVALARYYNITHDSVVKMHIKDLCQKYVNIINTNSNNPYAICESMFASWWGFLNTTSDLSKCLLHIGLELHNDEAIQLALKQYEWLLGFNPQGSSFIIGFGDDPIVPLQPCARVPEKTIGGLMPGMILLNGALSNYYDQYNQWSICEVGESSAVLFDLLAGFNSLVNPTDADSALPRYTYQSIPESNGKLIVSPNPAKNQVTVAYKINSGNNIELRIYSIKAENIASYTSHDKEGEKIFDVSNVKSGYYVVELIVDGTLCNRKSLIISK